MIAKRYIFLPLILAVSCFSSPGQTVKLRCTEVMQNGDVVVHWNPLLIGTGFYNYTLYWSDTFSGPYNDSVVIAAVAQDSFMHSGAGAALATKYYYMRIKTDTGITSPTDTLATMLLTHSTPDFEVIDLTWTPPHTPLLPDMYPWYMLYREYPPGNWMVVDSTQDLALSYHFRACNAGDDTVRFRIGVRDDSYGCISFSNPAGEVLKNQSNRFPPLIDSVSIDQDGKAIIGWETSQEPDIVGYKIFRVTTTNDSIDYVDGRNTTQYVHQSSSPCDGPLRYIILSVDSCGNESPFPFDPGTLLDKPHTTLYLQDVLYDPCTMENNLSWNEYENFDPSLGYSNIYFSENGGPYEVLATILPGQTTYTHELLLPFTNYSYFVRAFSLDEMKTSTSCVKGITTFNSPVPLFMYTCYVTVDGNEQVNMLVYTDTLAHVQLYRILRSNQQSGPYQEVSVIQNQGQEFISFSDAEALVNEESYYYQLEVIDSCGVASVIANTARTIFLQVEALPGLVSRLSWNAYESWSGGVAGYRIYRRLDGGSPDLIADLDPYTLVYDDDVSGLTGSISKISYQVEAYEGGSNIYGFSEQSYSNEVLSEQEPEVFMPNAFAPLGINNVLKPKTVFVGNDGYEFLVYNRWGQLIFTTSDPHMGWDGRFKGDYVPQDVYVYIVYFRNALNQLRYARGNVLVLY